MSTYTRKKAKLSAKDLKDAHAMVANGQVPGRGLDIADEGTPGLILRVTPLAVTWIYKTRVKSFRLGSGADLSAPAARIAAARARLDVRDGIDPRSDLRVFQHAIQSGAGLDDAADAAFPEEAELPSVEERRLTGPWDWCDLVEEFLQAHLPTLRPRWRSQYEKHLRRSLNGRLTNLQVNLVRPNDLLKLRDDVTNSLTLSAAADTIEAVKAALNWALRLHSHRAGFSHNTYPWWRDKVETGYASGTRKHTPRLNEIARTLVLAERHRALGGTGKETSDAVLGAFWATVLTGQRVSALTGTRRETVIPWEDGPPGWMVWTWTGEEMKKSGGAEVPHGIPLPPEAVAMIARYDSAPTSPFLFPSTRPERPLQGNALTQLFARLQGKSKVGKKGNLTLRPEDDLFAKHRIRPWVRHDVRRTLPTFLDLRRLGGSGSAILAHRKQRTPGEQSQVLERELAEAITLEHYIHGQRLEVKQSGMEAWVNAVLEAYEVERARFADP